jgi:hypothetical protein
MVARFSWYAFTPNRRRATEAGGRGVARFERAGWVHDPHVTRRDLAGKTPEWIARVGAGNWYCAACARKGRIGRQ